MVRGTNALLSDEKWEESEKREEKAVVSGRISICAGVQLASQRKNGPDGRWLMAPGALGPVLLRSAGYPAAARRFDLSAPSFKCALNPLGSAF